VARGLREISCHAFFHNIRGSQATRDCTLESRALDPAGADRGTTDCHAGLRSAGQVVDAAGCEGSAADDEKAAEAKMISLVKVGDISELLASATETAIS
jgi:hypothetical protein